MRVRGDIGGRAEKRGACAEGTGRKPVESRRSMSRRPLAGGSPVPPKEAQLMERVVETLEQVRAYLNAGYTPQTWNGLNIRNRRGT